VPLQLDLLIVLAILPGYLNQLINDFLGPCRQLDQQLGIHKVVIMQALNLFAQLVA